jgi:hypothetical protein
VPPLQQRHDLKRNQRDGVAAWMPLSVQPFFYLCRDRKFDAESDEGEEETMKASLATTLALQLLF